MGKKPIVTHSVVFRMWRGSILIAVGLLVVLFFYVFSIDRVINLFMISKAVAGTAGVMIGLSFAMSGFAYYFNFLDTKVGYRKYLGLVGFWLALAYSLMLPFVDPDRYFYGLLNNIGSADFLLGLSAMAILTFMALISNNRGIKKLGAQNWRRSLRFGYLAYALLIIRATIIEWDVWSAWWQAPDSLPPPRLLISVIALLVILFRGSMTISKAVRKKHLQTNGQKSV